MYLDNAHTNRSTWKYTYTGEQLLAFAQRRLQRACVEERNARESVITLTRDPAVSPTDRRVEEAKRAITVAATTVEEISVYVHEFRRNPSREYHLSSGDVVFLGLIDDDITQSVADAIKPSN